jgi:hypothetical protein
MGGMYLSVASESCFAAAEEEAEGVSPALEECGAGDVDSGDFDLRGTLM